MIRIGSIAAALGAALLACSPNLPAQIARGVVFEDLDNDGVREPGEPGLPAVAVSNGLHVVETSADGSYELPVEEGTILYVVKPSGYAVPLGEHNLPRFYYIHDPDGTSPGRGFRYPGITPSGPLPGSVDFPLTRIDEPDRFRVIWFSDPQTQRAEEVEFLRDDVVGELVGTQAAFGITVGDIMYDDLSLWPSYIEVVGRIGIPWYNAPGNHDMNYLAEDDRDSLETFKRFFGPTYYSFDYGQAHFVVLDDVGYAGADLSNRDAKGTYRGHFAEHQLVWLARDLARVPEDRLVVIAMHIPLRSYNRDGDPSRHVENFEELFPLLARFEHRFSVAGHMHTAEHHYFTLEDGVADGHPFHQHIIAAVSGSWWSGPRDDRDIPIADQRDGTPNGYYVMDVDGTDFSMRFKAAGRPKDHQMRILLDGPWLRERRAELPAPAGADPIRLSVPAAQLDSSEIVVNLFDGGPNSRLELRIDEGPARRMERVPRPDPLFALMLARNEERFRSWIRLEPSSHLWVAPLPGDLAPGAHRLSVNAVDEYGRAHPGSAGFRVITAAASGEGGSRHPEPVSPDPCSGE